MNPQPLEASYAHTCAVFLAGNGCVYLAQLSDVGRVERYIKIENSDLPLTNRQIAMVFANIGEGNNRTHVDYYCNEVLSFAMPIMELSRFRLEQVLHNLWKQTLDQPPIVLN